MLLLEFPGLSSWNVGPLMVDDDGFDGCVCMACLFSVNRNCFIISWFLLFSRTVLHATNCINLGLFSVTIAN